jgi:hypothetical protein
VASCVSIITPDATVEVMTNIPGTVPTPIVNSLGIATTVHRKPVQMSSVSQRAFPSPSMSKPAASNAAYEARRRNIGTRNRSWEAGIRPSSALRNAVSVKALKVMHSLMLTALDSDDRNASDQFTETIKKCIEAGDYEMLITAEAFAPVSYTLSEREDDTPFALSHELDFTNVDTTEWKPEYWGVYDFDAVTGVVNCLRDCKLLAYDEIPTKKDVRFFAHLYMSAAQMISYDYSMGQDDLIMVVDEYPERAPEIRKLLEDGVDDSLELRARLEGKVIAHLADGAL